MKAYTKLNRLFEKKIISIIIDTDVTPTDYLNRFARVESWASLADKFISDWTICINQVGKPDKTELTEIVRKYLGKLNGSYCDNNELKGFLAHYPLF